METNKTHKKKRSLKNLINTDKLAENIDNFNLEIDDFKKILNKYSIPSFSEDTNTSEVSELIKTIKSKTKKHTRKVEPIPIEKSIIDNFLESKSNEIKAEETISKTHKKVKFSDSVDSLIESVSKNSQSTNQIVKPKPLYLYNPDPRVDLREIVSESMYGQYQKQPSPSHHISPPLHPSPPTSQPVKSVKIIELDGGAPKPKPKSKEDSYQEKLQAQIHLIEDKIKEYDTYASYLPENHSFLLELRVEIINEKKKLKELLPKEKEPENKTFDNNNQNLVFKYDQKMAEKEYQDMMKNHQKVPKPHTSIKKPIKPIQHHQNHQHQQHHNKKVVVNEANNKTCSIIVAPRKEPIKQKEIVHISIPRKESIQPKKEIIHISIPRKEPIPPKKEQEPIQPKKEQEPIHPKKEHEPIPPKKEHESISPRKEHEPIPPRKHKTVTNHNKYKNIKFHRDKSEFYTPDKEISPNKWNTMICNDLTNINTHVKPVKLTQKKIKDFLIKESITNENNKTPPELMNFLYSSITENAYQINFIDVLNK